MPFKPSKLRRTDPRFVATTLRATDGGMLEIAWLLVNDVMPAVVEGDSSPRGR